MFVRGPRRPRINYFALFSHRPRTNIYFGVLGQPRTNILEVPSPPYEHSAEMFVRDPPSGKCSYGVEYSTPYEQFSLDAPRTNISGCIAPVRTFYFPVHPARKCRGMIVPEVKCSYGGDPQERGAHPASHAQRTNIPCPVRTFRTWGDPVRTFLGALGMFIGDPVRTFTHVLGMFVRGRGTSENPERGSAPNFRESVESAADVRTFPLLAENVRTGCRWATYEHLFLRKFG